MRASKRGICDASSDVCSSYLLAMPEGDAVALVSDLRHGRLGVNPYLPIILTSWESDKPLVRRVVDAGADDLQVKPLSTRIISTEARPVGIEWVSEVGCWCPAYKRKNQTEHMGDVNKKR